MSNLRWQQQSRKPSPGLFRVATRVHVEESGPGRTTQDWSNPASAQPALLQGSQGSYARYDVENGVLGCVRLVVTSWTIACQAPLFRGFPRQESWSGLPLPLAGDLPVPGIEPSSPVSRALQADSLPLRHQKAHYTGPSFIFHWLL